MLYISTSDGSTYIKLLQSMKPVGLVYIRLYQVKGPGEADCPVKPFIHNHNYFFIINSKVNQLWEERFVKEGFHLFQRVMTVLAAFSYSLLAYGISTSMFLMTVARYPHEVIMVIFQTVSYLINIHTFKFLNTTDQLTPCNNML